MCFIIDDTNETPTKDNCAITQSSITMYTLQLSTGDIVPFD